MIWSGNSGADVVDAILSLLVFDRDAAG